MLAPDERIDLISQRLTDDGRVTIAGLATELGVSEMTIRRDLDELAGLGAARRVRGGAVVLGPASLQDRHRRQARAKARIAEKLVRMIPGAGTVALDASSTLHRLAAELEGARDLTVVTNGVDTFDVLRGKPGITPVLTGGTLDARTGSLVGPVACRSARDFLFDLCMTSAAGLDPEFGSSEASIDEAEVKRAFAASATQLVLAVDHSKFGARGAARLFDLDEVATLVTDVDPRDEALRPYRRRVKIA